MTRHFDMSTPSLFAASRNLNNRQDKQVFTQNETVRNNLIHDSKEMAHMSGEGFP